MKHVQQVKSWASETFGASNTTANDEQKAEAA
jgi:hypothetical protein